MKSPLKSMPLSLFNLEYGKKMAEHNLTCGNPAARQVYFCAIIIDKNMKNKNEKKRKGRKKGRKLPVAKRECGRARKVIKKEGECLKAITFHSGNFLISSATGLQGYASSG